MNTIEKIFAVISLAYDGNNNERCVVAKVKESQREELDYVKQACFIIHNACGDNTEKGLNFIITEADEYGNRIIAQIIEGLKVVGIPSLVYEYGGIIEGRILGGIMKGTDWIECNDRDFSYLDFEALAKECAEMA